MRRVGRRVQRVESNVAGAAGGADEERRFHRGIGQLAHPLVGFDASGGGLGGGEAGPGRQAAVQLFPFGGVEARVGEFAEAKSAGRGAELEVAGRMALVCLAALAVRIVGVERRILEAAGRVNIAWLANILQEYVIAGAPVQAIGFFDRLGRAIRCAGLAAGRVVDDAPGPEAVIALVGTQHAIPVHQNADALLESVSMEAVIAGGGLEPDQPSDTFGLVQAFPGTSLEIGRVLIYGGRFGNWFSRHRCDSYRGIFSMGVADILKAGVENPEDGGQGQDGRDRGEQSTFHEFSPDQRHQIPVGRDSFIRPEIDNAENFSNS